MKTNISHLHEVLLTAAALTAIGVCQAQTTTVKQAEVVTTKGVEAVTTTKGMEGTIRSLGPDAIVIQAKGEEAPLAYRYGKTIQYVDDSGKAVSREILAAGLPVTVLYAREGDNLFAYRVIVHQEVVRNAGPVAVVPATPATANSVTQTTTTTATVETVKPTMAEGVISRWEPDRFELNTAKNGVMKFTYSQDTQFVDVDDKHVVSTRMKSGLPVTVRFKEVGDRIEATRIIVNERSTENVR